MPERKREPLWRGIVRLVLWLGVGGPLACCFAIVLISALGGNDPDIEIANSVEATQGLSATKTPAPVTENPVATATITPKPTKTSVVRSEANREADREEEAYREFIANYSRQLGQSFARFGDLITAMVEDPRLIQDQSWILGVGFNTGAAQHFIDVMIDYEAPSRYL